MNINTNNINPMDWHNTRLLEFIPVHFVRVKFRHDDRRSEVLAWAEQSTTGRFAIEAIIDTKKDTNRWLVNEEYQIGFENPADATMYTMFFR